MKIVLICSSPRRNGNTERILRLLEADLLKAADADGISLDTDFLSLSREDLQPCRGCRLCFEKGEEFCPVKDGIPQILSRMEQADAVVTASPVSVEDVNGTMKNWIDRLAFLCHRPAFYNKCAAVLCTSGSASSRRTLATMANALSAWGFRVVARDKFEMGARMDSAQIPVRFGARVNRTAAALLRSVQRQASQQPSFRSLVVFSIQQDHYRGAAEDTVDSLFWRNHGWLEKSAVSFPGKRPNPLKLFCARLAGRIITQTVMRGS